MQTTHKTSTTKVPGSDKISRVETILSERHDNITGMKKQIKELEDLQTYLRPKRPIYRETLRAIQENLIDFRKQLRTKINKQKANTRKIERTKKSLHTLKTTETLLHFLRKGKKQKTKKPKLNNVRKTRRGRKIDLKARKRRYDPKSKCRGMKYPAPKSDPRYCRDLRLPIE